MSESDFEPHPVKASVQKLSAVGAAKHFPAYFVSSSTDAYFRTSTMATQFNKLQKSHQLAIPVAQRT